MYRALLPGQIRVLDIAPGESQLSGYLRTVGLEQAPTYNALSYVWGTSAAVPHSILCDGTAIELTNNCHSALWHLRKKLGSFTIWVDAICIDQKDDNDKAAQIPLMGDIYAKAQQVFVWLGPASETSDKVMEFLSTHGLHEYGIDVPDVSTAVISPARRRGSLWRVLKRQNVRRRPHVYKHRQPWLWPKLAVRDSDLIDYLTNPCTTRLWMYQELLLASEPVLICGTTSIRWDQFSGGVLIIALLSSDESLTESLATWINLIYDRARVQNSALDIPLWERTVSRRVRLFNTILDLLPIVIISALLAATIAALSSLPGLELDKIIGPALGLPLLILWARWFWELKQIMTRSEVTLRPAAINRSGEGLLPALWQRACYHPLDKAYAVREILSRRGAKLGDPQYERPREDVYRELTEAILRTTQSADALVMAAHSPMPGCPSWVADWSADASTASELYSREMRLLEPTSSIEASRAYTLGNQIQAELLRNNRTISEGILTVEAFVLGRVVSTVSLQAMEDVSLATAEASNFEALRSFEWSMTKSCQLASLVPRFNRTCQHTTKDWEKWNRHLVASNVSWELQPKKFRSMTIELCNMITQEAVILCKVQLSGIDTVAFGRGICKGDLVLRFKTMSQPLFVRRVGRDNAIKLVALYAQTNEDWWNAAYSKYWVENRDAQLFHLH